MREAVVLAATGLLIAGFGIAIWYGRTELLAQYPEQDGPEELATRAGGILTAHGLLTIGIATVVGQSDESPILVGSWAALTVVVAFAVAALAATYN